MRQTAHTANWSEIKLKSKFHKTEIYAGGIVVTEVPKKTFRQAITHKPLHKTINHPECIFWFIRDPEWSPNRYRCFKHPKKSYLEELGLVIKADLYISLSKGDIAALSMRLP